MNTFASLQAHSVTADTTDAPWQQTPQPSVITSDDLARIFNTALVATRDQPSRDWHSEIQRLMDTPAFRSLLNAIRQLARAQGLSEAAAAEEMIRTVRALDSSWRDYVFQEGLDRIKSSG